MSKRSSELGNSGILRVDVIESGSGYTDAEVKINGVGSGAEIVASISSGQVSNVTVINGGSGYNRNTSGEIEGDGVGARVRVVVAEPDSTQIRILEVQDGHSVNNIRFIKTSIEGDNVDRHVVCEGSFCVFDQMRWESIVPNIHFVRKPWSVVGGSENKVVNGGHASDRIYYSQEGSGIMNYVDRSSRGVNMVSFNQAYRLRSFNGTSLIRMYDGSRLNFMNRGITSQFDNEWCHDIGASGLKLKRSSDEYPRIQLDGENGRIFIGNGEYENLPFISSGNGSPEGVVNAPIGSIYINRQGTGNLSRNLWEKVSNSSSNIGWRLVGLQNSATINARGIVLQSDKILNVDTEEAVDLDTSLILVNELKDKLNEVINKLRAAGIINT